MPIEPSISVHIVYIMCTLYWRNEQQFLWLWYWKKSNACFELTFNLQLVYDKDTFSTDDFMGEAEIDIQPLVAAAKAYETSSVTESTQLGKWVASKDNTLVQDGVITLIDGMVKQDISLRLQNVERGVLEIELECVPLTQ